MKKFFLSVFLLTTVMVSSHAQFFLGGKVEFDTNVLKYRKDRNFEIKDYFTNTNWFTDFAFDKTSLYLGYNHKILGARIQLNPFHSLTFSDKWYVPFFKDTYVWLNLFNIPNIMRVNDKNLDFSAKITAGEFTKRRASLFDTISGDRTWKYGVVFYEASKDATFSEDVFYVSETDDMRGLIAEIKFGPIAFEYSPISFYLDYTKETRTHNLNESGKVGSRGGFIDFVTNKSNPSEYSDNRHDTKQFMSAFRLSSDPMFQDHFKFSAMYQFFNVKDVKSGASDVGPTNPKRNITAHNLGIVLEGVLPFEVGVSLGYSREFFTQVNDFKDSMLELKADKMHALEIRAAWDAYKAINLPLLIETQNKFAWSKDMGIAPRDDITADAVAVQKYSSSNVIWNYLAARYTLAPSMFATIEFMNKFGKIYKADVKTKDALYTNRFSVTPSFRYYLLENIYVQAGVELSWHKSWATKTVDGKAEEEKIGASTTDISKVDTVFPRNGWHIAVPIKVSFEF